MENKSTKLLSVVLVILVIALIGAAAYILTGHDTPGTAPSANLNTSSVPTASEHVPSPPAAKNIAPDSSKPASSLPMGSDSRTDRMERPDPHQIPRQLTEEQKAENQRELAKMAEALPDNMWVPKEPTAGFAPERGERLRKSIELSDKIRKETATPQEQKEYYSFKLKETTDKIELIRYIAQRTKELSSQNGKKYLTQSDIDTGEERIAELEQQAEEFKQKLSEISPDSK